MSAILQGEYKEQDRYGVQMESEKGRYQSQGS